MKKTDVFDTDILVVGTGPTGGTTALAAARAGVRVHVVTQFHWMANTPRAHITNQRAMEVFRDLGLKDPIERRATPWELMGDTTFCSSFAGEEICRAHWWGTGEQRKGDYLKASPCGLVDLIQSEVEPILLEWGARAGATFALNTEFLRFEEDNEGVTVFLRDRLTDREYTMRARYLVGADGARSRVFEQAGLPLEGHLARGAHVYVQFKADLTRYAQHRPSILNYVVSDELGFGEIGFGLLRATKPWHEWIAGWGFDTTNGEPDLSEGELTARVRTLIGDPQVEVELGQPSVWYVNEAYAPIYSKGRIFCGGDACHRHPPSSGLGLNTCVQDAHNLGWKLAYVLKGYAGEELLQSYTQERAPVGLQIVKRANQSRRDYAAMHAVLRIPGAEKPTAAGIARLRDPGPEGVEARKALEAALDLKQSEFNAEGVEMNQRYTSGALIPEPSALPEQFMRDPHLYHQPTTRPGAKIPHVWLVDRHGKKRSTLDVTGKSMFSVVTGLAGTAWAEAVQRLALSYVRCVVVDSPDTKDLYREWQRIREIAEDGVLLVRPDGYIAWRQSEGPLDADTATELLRSALSRVLATAI
jgi:2,4-dichlorophenol 6-monooxygenase